MTPFLPQIHGLEEIRDHLARWYVSGRFPIGLLLAGAAGRGKRTLALALAEVLLTDRYDGRDPRVLSGNHPDLEVLEPEANHRQLSIDRIRALTETFSLTGGTCRVALILGADVLTEEAANALLKLLEEPPPGARLILTASSVDGVKETLVSRCRMLRVPHAGTAATEQFLVSRGVEPIRAARAALLAEGRLGRALELSRADAACALFHPSLRSFLEPEGAAGSAHELLQEWKGEGAAPEELRRALRQVIDLALVVLARAARRNRGQPNEVDRELLAHVPSLERLSVEQIEARMATLVRAASDVDRNVALDLLLASLFASWSS